MTIINANHYLEQLLAPAALERIARLCKFCLRQRAITPAMLVPALLRAMGGDQVNDIAGLHRHFNALQLVNAHQVSYKPFHNQLRKESFALFMKAMSQLRVAWGAQRLMQATRDIHCLPITLQHPSPAQIIPQIARRHPMEPRHPLLQPPVISVHMLDVIRIHHPLSRPVMDHLMCHALLFAEAGIHRRPVAAQHRIGGDERF
ncbi:hypothetical protein D3C87_884600 [compost metagenome]